MHHQREQFTLLSLLIHNQLIECQEQIDTNRWSKHIEVQLVEITEEERPPQFTYQTTETQL
jgi:hypothetical protein